MHSEKSITRLDGITFQVQVAGAIGVLSHGARVNLEGVYIVGVPGHHHIVPLVVVERLVRVALHERRAVAKVEDIMDKTTIKKTQEEIVNSRI